MVSNSNSLCFSFLIGLRRRIGKQWQQEYSKAGALQRCLSRCWLTKLLSPTETWMFYFCVSYCISFRRFTVRIQECYRHSHSQKNTGLWFSKVVSSFFLQQEDGKQYFVALSSPWDLKAWNIWIIKQGETFYWKRRSNLHATYTI